MSEHLLCGQVDNAAAPAAVAAELYVLSTGYGMAIGTDALLTIQTKEIAPLGPDGRGIFRRALVTVLYDNACTVRVTPTVDFTVTLPATTHSFAAPAAPTKTVLPVPMAHVGTYVSLLVEVISRAGLVEFGSSARIAVSPRTQAFPQVTGAGV